MPVNYLYETTIISCLICTMLLICLFVLKKYRISKICSTDQIELINNMYISNKEKLILVKVAGKKILLGVTPNNITTLALLDYIQDGNDHETFNELLKIRADK